ncbi:hypothetical protein [Roseateles sp. LYH14W]|uniref:Restriction endonuclease type IV Mrr domain-containing protein n=1 Tax=Pelomonas parva TaxID=3299032 RepID=A0ABW7EX41_9BURK
MEHIAPLLQTILWVALAGGIVWRFHRPIYDLLTALGRRVDAGSTIKAGPFELSEQLKPQDPVKVEAKLTNEIKEATPPPKLSVDSEHLEPSNLARITKSRFLQAEDLVLRAIQTEYGSPINRQVTAGRDDGFDGIFLSSGRVSVVEVKYVSRGGPGHRFQESITRLTQSVRTYGWPDAQIILALVFEDAEQVGRTRELLVAMFAKNPVPVVVRCYSLSELRSLFGIEDAGGAG